MRSFTTKIDEINFNLLWRSLADREEKLQKKMEDYQGVNYTEIGLAVAHDLAHLHRYKEQLKALAKKAAFNSGCFNLDDDIFVVFEP